MFGVDVGLVYAGVSALLLGVYLFSIKRYFDEYPATVYVTLTYACSLAWYLPIAAVTVDSGFVPADAGLPALGVLVLMVCGSIIATLAAFRAIAIGEVSYVAPISKLVPVFVVPVEFLALGQRLTFVQTTGVCIATAAVYVANYEPGALFEPIVRAARSRPAQLALLSAAAFGVTDVSKRALTQELALPPETVNIAFFLGVPLAIAPLAIRQFPDGIRADLGKFLALGLLLAVAEHLVILSFTTLPASLASPVVNSSAVFAVVLGGVFLGEDAFRVRLVAAGLAVTGVTLIGLG